MGAPGAEKALTGIMRWSTRPEWQLRADEVFGEHIGDVCDEHEVSRDELQDILGDAYLDLFGCTFENLLTRRFDGTNLVDDYLKRRGFKETVPVKTYLRALQNSVMSIYEVVATSPGSHFVARDLIRGGAPVQVEDKLASIDLLRWDRLAARMLSIRGKTYMSASVLPLSFEAAAAILDAARQVMKRLDEIPLDPDVDMAALAGASLVDLMLEGFAPFVTQIWLRTYLDDILDQVPDHTLEGDPVVYTKTRFSMVEPADLAAVSDRLDAHTELIRDKEREDRWFWMVEVEGGPKVAFTDNPTMVGKRLMGWLAIEDGELILSALSVPRGEHGAALVVETLGPLVGEPRVEVVSPGDEILTSAAAPAAPSILREGQLSLFPEAEGPSVQAALDQHYREALKTPLPFLDDKTPKQAIRSETGRHQVADWLKSLENQEAHHVRDTGDTPYDFTWMWEALKIVNLRQ
jgi:hypothetical protein